MKLADGFGAVDKECLATILDSIIGPFFTLDNQWLFTYLNKEAENYFEINREEVLGRKIWDVFPKFVDTPFYEKCIEAMEQRTTLHFETKGVYNPIYVEFHVHPLQEGLAVYFRDITKRKLMEKSLEENERTFRVIFDFSFQFISLIRPDGTMIEVNQTALDFAGLRHEEVIDKPFWDAKWWSLSEQTRKKLRNAISKAAKGEFIRYEVDIIGANDRIITIDFSIKPVFDEAGQVVLLIPEGRDISERRRTKEELRLSEERFYKAFHAGPDIKTITELETGIYIDVNDQFLRNSGFSRDEVIGHRAEDLIWESGIRPEVVEQLLQEGKIENREFTFKTKSGRKVTVLLSMVPIEINGKQYILSSSSDITQLKQLEKEMARLDRLHLVGEMAAGIGHEIRNPMTTVRGFLQLLGEKERDVQNKEYYKLMIDELDRANSIITEYLSLARDKVAPKELNNLNLILGTLYPLLLADALKEDKVIFLEREDIPSLQLNEKEIRQLLLNLVRNGLEAMPPGGKMVISTYIDKKEIVLSVEDEGTGIGPEILDKLGTPFVTTKGQGTGLGLAVCYSIAHRHNARIDIKTTSSGTTFLVRFKLAGLGERAGKAV